jgi:hypothetical protein
MFIEVDLPEPDVAEYADRSIHFLDGHIVPAVPSREVA